MDMYVSPPYSKLLRVRDEMCDSEETGNIFYLSNLAELLHLIELENARQAGTHDLEIGAIDRVACAWGYPDDEIWSGGFVLELRDGRRVYLEGHADIADWNESLGVSVRRLAADEEKPEFPILHLSQVQGWRDELPELSEYLQRVQA